MRINFQTLYTQLKNNLTNDNKENIILLKQRLEEKLKTTINDDFMIQFEFFILNQAETKEMTLKQVLNRFFEVFKMYYEMNTREETTRTKDELFLSEILKDFTFKKYVSFKLRNRKVVFYIYNNEDKEKIKRINNKNLAIEKIEFFTHDINNKIKDAKVIKDLIKIHLDKYRM